MKKLLKIIAPPIVVILFTVLYINDSECSLVGAVCMACVIGGLFSSPSLTAGEKPDTWHWELSFASSLHYFLFLRKI